jgi:hypothetical protein
MKIKGQLILAAAFASFHLGNATDGWSGKTRNLIGKSVQDVAITEAPRFDDRVLQDDLSEVLSTTTGKVMTREEGQFGRQLVTDYTCVSNSIAVIMGNKTSQDLLTCDTADGKHYSVPWIPDTVLQANKKDIIEGIVELNVMDMEGAYLNDETATLVMPPSLQSQRLEVKDLFKRKNDNMNQGQLFDRSRRSLAITGTRSALVVRVVTSDKAPPGSEAYLSNNVFGNGADGRVDPLTMKSHFDTCSIGQLKIVEAADRNGKTLRIQKGKFNYTHYLAKKDIHRLILSSLGTHTSLRSCNCGIEHACWQQRRCAAKRCLGKIDR